MGTFSSITGRENYGPFGQCKHVRIYSTGSGYGLGKMRRHRCTRPATGPDGYCTQHRKQHEREMGGR